MIWWTSWVAPWTFSYRLIMRMSLSSNTKLTRRGFLSLVRNKAQGYYIDWLGDHVARALELVPVGAGSKPAIAPPNHPLPSHSLVNHSPRGFGKTNKEYVNNELWTHGVVGRWNSRIVDDQTAVMRQLIPQNHNERSFGIDSYRRKRWRRSWGKQGKEHKMESRQTI